MMEMKGGKRDHEPLDEKISRVMTTRKKTNVIIEYSAGFGKKKTAVTRRARRAT